MANYKMIEDGGMEKENRERPAEIRVQTVTEKCKMSMIAMPKFRFYQQEEEQPKATSKRKYVVFLIVITILILVGICSVIAGIIISDRTPSEDVWKVHTLRLNTTVAGEVEELIQFDPADKIVKYTIPGSQFTANYDYSRGLVVIKTTAQTQAMEERCFLTSVTPNKEGTKSFNSDIFDAFLKETKIVNVKNSSANIRNYTISQAPIFDVDFLQDRLKNLCLNLDTRWLIPIPLNDKTSQDFDRPHTDSNTELVRGCVWTAEVKYTSISIKRDCYIISDIL